MHYSVKYKGTGLSSRKNFGKAFHYQKAPLSVPQYQITKENISQEWERYQKALELTKKQLLTCQKNTEENLGKKEADVFEIQLALLDDDYLSKTLYKELESSLYNVEVCLKKVIDSCVHELKRHTMLHIRESYLDLNDVTSRIIKNLLLKEYSLNSQEDLEGKVIIAANLEPSDVFELMGKKIAGIILEDYCTASHAIVIAHGLNIPIIIGVEGICKKIANDDTILMDGANGEIFVNPSQEYVNHYLNTSTPTTKVHSNKKNAIKVDFWLTYAPNVTKNFIESSNAKGIGLLRSESIFLNRQALPDEEEQFLFYKSVVEKFAPYPVVLRVLDIGGDKIAKSIAQQEPNPFLGMRGIRYCLHDNTLFKQQLRAMLRASIFGEIQILYPMITGLEDLLQANTVLEECKQELKNKGIRYAKSIPVGSMIEVPSAVLLMDQLSRNCQFFSLGTNDLSQYTLAADRTNSLVARRYGDLHPSVLRMLKMVFENAQKLGMPICICGEMASSVTGFLVGLAIGFRSFCVHEDQINHLKTLVNSLKEKDLNFIASKVLNFTCSHEIFKFLNNY